MNNDTHIKIKKILDYVYPDCYSIKDIFDSEVDLTIVSIVITPTPQSEYIKSLQTLFQQIITDTSVCIDINNNVISEIEKIKEDVYVYAQKAKYFNKPIDLPPQNAFVRKITHGYINKKLNLKSESVGVGRDRHIVIHPIVASE